MRQFDFFSAVLTIGFEQLAYTFLEGSMAQICVSVDGFVEGTSLMRSAHLSFTPGTAGMAA